MMERQEMETYTIIKKGSNINHCLPIPLEFTDMDLEITIKPVRKGSEFRKKIEMLLKKNENITPFNEIADPVKWQKEIRSDW
jgi:hypothetical protein